LQRYHQTKLPHIRAEEQPQLFAVLGSVSDFRNPAKVLNRNDLERWMRENEDALRNEVASWLPTELSVPDTEKLLDNLVDGTLAPIDDAITDEAETGASVGAGRMAGADPGAG